MEVTGTALMQAAMWLACMAALAGAGTGCSGAKVTTKASDQVARYTVKTIAVVPFSAIGTPQAADQAQPYLSTPQGVSRSDISVSVPSNAEPLPRQTVTVPPHAAEKITALFWNRLQKREGLQVIAGAKAAQSTKPEAQSSPEAVGAAVARQLNVDAAVIGQVRVYQERVGSRLGASPPASVGFEVRVVAPDGQVLWVGNYYERQRPMGEDLMGFIQRRGAFVTAEELAEFGVEEVMKEFPFGQQGEQ